MTLYNPISTFVQNMRLLFKRRVQDSQPAVAGNGLGTTDVPDRIGYVYARFPAGKAADGGSLFTPPFTVRSAGAVFPNYDGADIHVAYNRNRELQIVEGNYQALDKAGIDTRSFNPLHQQSKWVYLWQLTIGLCTAVATTLNDSYLVSIKRHLTYANNVFSYFETGEAADKIDLSAYVPAVDMHCYAAVWRDTYTNAIEVTTSTAQSLFTPLDVTDLNQLATSRPPDSVPYKAFVLANNAGTISQNAADIDLRQLLNTPTAWGFPVPVAFRERIQPNRQQVVYGSLPVTGSLEVLGSLVVI